MERARPPPHAALKESQKPRTQAMTRTDCAQMAKHHRKPPPLFVARVPPPAWTHSPTQDASRFSQTDAPATPPCRRNRPPTAASPLRRRRRRRHRPRPRPALPPAGSAAVPSACPGGGSPPYNMGRTAATRTARRSGGARGKPRSPAPRAPPPAPAKGDSGSRAPCARRRAPRAAPSAHQSGRSRPPPAPEQKQCK